MKSVKSAHTCAIKISRTIPATTPIENIKSISFICYVSRISACAAYQTNKLR